MAQTQVGQLCYGIGTGCEDVFWHRKWLFKCVVVKKSDVQVFWHRK